MAATVKSDHFTRQSVLPRILPSSANENPRKRPLTIPVSRRLVPAAESCLPHSIHHPRGRPGPTDRRKEQVLDRRQRYPLIPTHLQKTPRAPLRLALARSPVWHP